MGTGGAGCEGGCARASERGRASVSGSGAASAGEEGVRCAVRDARGTPDSDAGAAGGPRGDAALAEGPGVPGEAHEVAGPAGRGGWAAGDSSRCPSSRSLRSFFLVCCSPRAPLCRRFLEVRGMGAHSMDATNPPLTCTYVPDSHGNPHTSRLRRSHRQKRRLVSAQDGKRGLQALKPAARPGAGTCTERTAHVDIRHDYILIEVEAGLNGAETRR